MRMIIKVNFVAHYKILLRLIIKIILNNFYVEI